MNKFIRLCVSSPWLVILAAMLVAALGWQSMREVPVDAFPDISENQTIVFTNWMGRSPQDVEDQITYPLSTELQGIPGVKEIRGMSGFGFSQIYVVFEDDIDFYWARTRVLERLASLSDLLPSGVQPQIGPEATALGQIFWYTLEGPGYDLGTLRSLQDFYVAYGLQTVDGVAEVASAGGFVRQYQIDVDPDRLKAYDVTLSEVLSAVRRGNIDVGAKTLERNGLEAIVRGVGFIKSEADVASLVIKARDGTPVYVHNVADVRLGPDFRRGALADEKGECVGGVVAMRFGANPEHVIEGLKAKIIDLEKGLPEGVKIVPFYDRTKLIHETNATLESTLIQELFITLFVVLFFLLHVRTSLIVAITLPLAVFSCFIGMRFLGLGADIMSLSGIAIAIGTVVDMGIIMSENIFSSLTERGERSRSEAIADAAAEVGPAIMTAVATTIVSFLPVFFLTGQSGKLFKPLAWTKTFAMCAAVIIAITLVPALCRLFLKTRDASHDSPWARRFRLFSVSFFGVLGLLVGWRIAGLSWMPPLQPWLSSLLLGGGLAALVWRMGVEELRPIDENPVSRLIVSVYQPILRWVLRNKGIFLIAPTLVILSGATIFFGAKKVLSPIQRVADVVNFDLGELRVVDAISKRFPGIGSEFMPPLDEGSYLAMPSLLSQASLNKTMETMQRMNKEIATIPEVAQVVGKLGRAETALDPAPTGMMEVVVNLKPEDEWREGVTRQDILKELKRKSRIIGTAPSWLQPIETRVVMLQSGIRATMALRLMGSPRKNDGSTYKGEEALRIMESALIEMEEVVRSVKGAVDVTALRLGGKPYIEFEINREAISRYGVKVQDVQDVIETAIGGVNLTSSLEGRERYPIRVQYARELRDDFSDLEGILVPTPSGARIPIALLADIRYPVGPAAIRTENGQLTGYLMFNAFDRDETSVIEDALAAVETWREKMKLDHNMDPIPAGLTLSATGRYKNKVEADERLILIIPLVLGINFFLIFMQFRNVAMTITIFTAIPVAFGGGFLLIGFYPELLDLLFALGIRDQPSTGPVYLTTAVWVGFIALFGIAVDDGVVIGTYLDQTFKKRRPKTVEEVRAAIIEAGSRRIRPMMMTSTTTIMALLPILWSTGRGSDLMQPMTLPLVGGMVFAFVTVFVVPVVYSGIMEFKLLRGIELVPEDPKEESRSPSPAPQLTSS